MGRFLLAVFTVIFVQHANASSVLDLNQASIGGTGCAGASVRALSGSILQIRTPGLSNVSPQASTISRKACAVAIPFKLKSNQKLIVSTGRVNVSLKLKHGAVAKTNAEVFTAGTQGARVAAADNGPKNQVSLLKLGTIATACGEDGILRTNLSQVLTAKAAGSKAGINSAILRLQVVKCN
jgi:hypothetical protein